MPELTVIARIRTQFPEKFGIPRQSGLAPQTWGTVFFEPPYQNPDALRGLSGFSHLWLLWGFDRVRRTGWSATVRPPRLGGNARMGVFATRSPFRPNAIGLSCVTLCEVRTHTPDGPLLLVGGADMADNTPIYDIKPYLPYCDSHPEATAGFAGDAPGNALNVLIPEALEERIPQVHRAALRAVLAQDPRPAYQDDGTRVYGMAFAGMNVRFFVDGQQLTVADITPYRKQKAMPINGDTNKGL